MWCFCDDRGVHPAKPKTLKAEVFPMDDITAEHVEQLVGELKAAGLLYEFAAEGETWWAVTGWGKHQRIEKPCAKYPAPPPKFDDQSPTVRLPVVDWSATAGVRNGMEGKGKEGKGGEVEEGAAPPSPKPRKRGSALPEDFQISDRVRKWAQSKGWAAHLEAHLEHFRGYCAASGKTYVDHDEAFMNAIRADWGGIRRQASGPMQAAVPRPAAQAPADAIVAEIRRADAVKTPMPESIRNLVKARLAA